ncbi:hypothetical protein CVT30_09565 [Streptomyces sp. AMCC400023]|nr:hypothetical protein CVT30_09565 [Streptomyces sp. AMCC400023]
MYCWYRELLRPRQPRLSSRQPLITAGHPVRSSVPSPSCNESGFETPPPGRHACTAARQFVSAGPCWISTTRETISVRATNVYSGEHRFCALDKEAPPSAVARMDPGSPRRTSRDATDRGVSRRRRFSPRPSPPRRARATHGRATCHAPQHRGSRARSCCLVVPPPTPSTRAGA